MPIKSEYHDGRRLRPLEMRDCHHLWRCFEFQAGPLSSYRLSMSRSWYPSFRHPQSISKSAALHFVFRRHVSHMVMMKQGPETPYNGVRRMRLPIAGGLIFLTLAYFAAVQLLRDSGTYLKPADEFCEKSASDKAHQPCSRPDLAAFQISSGFAIFYVGWLGFKTWYISKTVHRNLPGTPEGRLFGWLHESERIAAANFTFQVWDFIISLLIPEHCTAIFLTHHLMAAVVSWFSLHYQILHYYGIYFLGLTETSSIFLVLIDLARYFPPESGTVFAHIVAICQPAFLISFFWYRVAMWWVISWRLWSDVLTVTGNGRAEALRPGKTFVLKYVYLPFNILLGLLQLHWFRFIMDETKKVVFGHEMPDHSQGTE